MTAPKRRWPTIAIRVLAALAASIVALFAFDVVVAALQVEGPPHARVSHAREVAIVWAALFGISALFAVAQVIALIRALTH